MASLAEFYLPFVAVLQFVIAGLILWLGRFSTRALLAANILVCNAVQGIAVMAYNLEEFYGRPGLREWFLRWTGDDAIFVSAITEYLIAASVGLLAASLLRPLPRGRTMLLLYGVFGLIPWLASVLMDGGLALRYRTISSGTGFIFAIALVYTCTVALPGVLRMRGTSERAHALLVLAAVLIPMAQQHFWYTLALQTPVSDMRPDQSMTLLAVGLISAVVLVMAVTRLAEAYRRDRDRAALWLAIAIGASMLFTYLRRDVFQDFVGDWFPASTQVFAQLIRPALLLLAFARFEYVRLPRHVLRPLGILSSLMMGLAVFVVIQFVMHQRPYVTYGLDTLPAMAGLAAGLLVAVLAMPRLVQAVDDAALEDEAGGRGRRLERYKAALMADDPDAPRLRTELGITRKEHDAMQAVLAGNLVIPEVAARGLRPGDRVEGYAIMAPLGRGGQGVVVRAEDAQGRQVVIKQVRDAWAANAQARVEALRREAAAGTGMREVIQNPFAAYLVRDFVPGRPMDQVPDVDARRVHMDVTAQLAAMHARGWVHGDIKPSNIIITPEGDAVLIDEGAAYEIDATRTVAYASKAYAAPEQSAGSSLAATDVYQLAKVLEPYQPSGLKQWIRQALQADPARRPRLVQ